MKIEIVFENEYGNEMKWGAMNLICVEIEEKIHHTSSLIQHPIWLKKKTSNLIERESNTDLSLQHAVQIQPALNMETPHTDTD